MVPSPAVLSLATIVLLMGLGVAISRQRPLRLALPGQIAVTGGLAATFVYSLDGPREGRASYVLAGGGKRRLPTSPPVRAGPDPLIRMAKDLVEP